jgi:hypothetical protein
MTAIWDEAFLKQRERDAREHALAVQSDQDWESAVMQFERETSDVSEGFVDCLLSGCRRALRCVGNPPICMPRCRREFEPGVAQEQVEEIYAEIQEERRDAAAQDRAPEVERALDYVQEDDEAIDEPPPPPRDEPERDMKIVREALQRDDAPSQPPPQPQLPKPEPAVAPPPDPLAADARPAAPAAPPPPDPWEPTISPEVEERINRIWADYVAGRPMPRPPPRIRSL